ncbi:NAD(+)/NADH kinase [Anaerovoracaceae bacterium SGI.195]
MLTSKEKIYIYSNGTSSSKETRRRLEEKLEKSGYSLAKSAGEKPDLIVVIGGDGTLLEAIHKFNFPESQFIGINTGHLGFFQELMPSQLDDFIFNYGHDKFAIQELSTVDINVRTNDCYFTHTGLNEIAIKGSDNHSIHLNMSIDGSFIQRFSGDGVVIATPAGSTAYNYSLGGSIVDPRVNVLQLTPIAPMNTIAYRSFTSSILLPPELTLGISPDIRTDEKPIRIIFDGYYKEYTDIKSMEVSMGTRTIKLLRFENYDFWEKVKSKFLL